MIGDYCKVYPLKKFREFSGWTQKINTLKVKRPVDWQELEFDVPLDDDVNLYLQENYFVTGCVFKDEQVVFDNVTPEWIEFCKQTLKFEIPLFAEG